MAIIATFSNATELAAEIEVRNQFLQALKEGKLPPFAETVQTEVPTLVVGDVSVVAPVTAAITAPVIPAVPVIPTV